MSRYSSDDDIEITGYKQGHDSADELQDLRIYERQCPRDMVDANDALKDVRKRISMHRAAKSISNGNHSEYQFGIVYHLCLRGIRQYWLKKQASDTRILIDDEAKTMYEIRENTIVKFEYKHGLKWQEERWRIFPITENLQPQ